MKKPVMLMRTKGVGGTLLSKHAGCPGLSKSVGEFAGRGNLQAAVHFWKIDEGSGTTLTDSITEADSGVTTVEIGLAGGATVWNGSTSITSKITSSLQAGTIVSPTTNPFLFIWVGYQTAGTLETIHMMYGNTKGSVPANLGMGLYNGDMLELKWDVPTADEASGASTLEFKTEVRAFGFYYDGDESMMAYQTESGVAVLNSTITDPGMADGFTAPVTNQILLAPGGGSNRVDIYGIAAFNFDSTKPTEAQIKTALEQCETNWTAGNKVLPAVFGY